VVIFQKIQLNNAMYVILVYDAHTSRGPRLLKLCRRYLHWIQNSVFEGEISESALRELKLRAGKILEDDDSLIVFHSREERWLEKEVLGSERSSTDNIL
jgi:CRISPR-associated protein Cas2